MTSSSPSSSQSSSQASSQPSSDSAIDTVSDSSTDSNTVSPLTETEVGLNVTRVRDLTPMQWRSGIAAWLGWLFDGLDSSLYIMVALPFVTLLLHNADKPSVNRHASYIQAAFLVGWAVGGAVFGRVGDRFGRSRTISITILTYAAFTGLQGLAWSWTSLLAFRFLSALGIGGEWAAGSSLISETWPRRWRHWVSAILQSAYQGGFILASVCYLLLKTANPRWIFAIGVLPALIVFWIRKSIPEPKEWHAAKQAADYVEPKIGDLFRGAVLRTTVLTILLCSAALTTVWALIFWYPQQLRNLPDVLSMARAAREAYVSQAQLICFAVAIGGNFFAAAIARYLGYRKATFVMFLGGAISMYLAYGFPHDHISILLYASIAHFFVQGVFGLFPLYIPPLFPTLLRTTGAGFCYNIGRLVAAVGTIVFGLIHPLKEVSDFNRALVWVGMLYIPALLVTFFIPEPSDDKR